MEQTLTQLVDIGQSWANQPSQLVDPMKVMLVSVVCRIGSHSTSDDQTGYQDMQEVSQWKEFNNPVNRLKGYLQHRKLWTQVGHHL